MFEKHFKDLQPGELFSLFGHGLSVKIAKDTALDLFSGQIYPLHFNKKVSLYSSFKFSQKLFLAQRQGNPVICHKIHGGFECSRFLITKTELCREASDLQGIPYHADDGIDIIIRDILKSIKTAYNMAEYLASKRERQD